MCFHPDHPPPSCMGSSVLLQGPQMRKGLPRLTFPVSPNVATRRQSSAMGWSQAFSKKLYLLILLPINLGPWANYSHFFFFFHLEDGGAGETSQENLTFRYNECKTSNTVWNISFLFSLKLYLAFSFTHTKGTLPAYLLFSYFTWDMLFYYFELQCSHL